MAEVHEVYRPKRRARIWPAVVMFLVVLLLIGIIIAMIMNIRGSISWPAGSIEFGFRPNLFITRTEQAAIPAPASRVATNDTTTDAAPTPVPSDAVQSQSEPTAAQQTTPE
jgi:hypothetical protein